MLKKYKSSKIIYKPSYLLNHGLYRAENEKQGAKKLMFKSNSF